ncbi:hypothetical protein ACHAXS_011113 [Conticribra weissflogii]
MSTPLSSRRSPRLSNYHGTPATGTRSATKGKPATPFSCISAGSDGDVGKKQCRTPSTTPSAKKTKYTPKKSAENNGHGSISSERGGSECLETTGKDDNSTARGSAACSPSSIKPETVRSSERRSGTRRLDATTSGGSRTRIGTYYSTARNERDLWLLELDKKSCKKTNESANTFETNVCNDKDNQVTGRKDVPELDDNVATIANIDDNDAGNDEDIASASLGNATKFSGIPNASPGATNDRRKTVTTPLPVETQSSETILVATKPTYPASSPANSVEKRPSPQTISFLPPVEDEFYITNVSKKKLASPNDKFYNSFSYEKQWDELEAAPTIAEPRVIYSVNKSSPSAYINANDLATSNTDGLRETNLLTTSFLSSPTNAKNDNSATTLSAAPMSSVSMTPELNSYKICNAAPLDNDVSKANKLEKKWDELEVAPSMEELRNSIRKANCHSIARSPPSSSINANDLTTSNPPRSRETIPTTYILRSPTKSSNYVAAIDTYTGMHTASMTPDSKPSKLRKSISPRSRGSTAPSSVLASPTTSLELNASPHKTRPASSSHETNRSPKRQKSTRMKSQTTRNNPRFAMSLESYGAAIANSLSSPARTDTLCPDKSAKRQPFVSPGKRSSAESALHFLAKKTCAAQNNGDNKNDAQRNAENLGCPSLVSCSKNAKTDHENDANLKPTSPNRPSLIESGVSLDEMIRNYVPANRNDEKWLRHFQKWRSLQHIDEIDISKNRMNGNTSPLPKGWVRTQQTYCRLLKSRNQLASSDARVALLEKAGFLLDELHSKLSISANDANNSDKGNTFDDSDVPMTTNAVEDRSNNARVDKHKTKAPELFDEANHSSKLLISDQADAVPKQHSNDHERRRTPAEDGEPETKRKSPRQSCPTDFFHNSVFINMILSSKRTTRNPEKAAQVLRKPGDLASDNAIESECTHLKQKQPSYSKKISSNNFSETLSSTSNAKSENAGKQSKNTSSKTYETESTDIRNQKLFVKKKSRGCRHSLSSFFVLDDPENDPRNGRSTPSFLSHKMLEEHLKKIKPQKRRSDEKKSEEMSIAETTTSNLSLKQNSINKADDVPAILNRGDNEGRKPEKDVSHKSTIRVDNADDTVAMLQVNIATNPSSPESPLRAIKLLSSLPDVKPQTSSKTLKSKEKENHERSKKCILEFDQGSKCEDQAFSSQKHSTASPDAENCPPDNPLMSLEKEKLKNDIITGQPSTESLQETPSLTKELKPSLPENDNALKATAKKKNLAGTPEFASIFSLSPTSPLGGDHLLEKSFLDRTPESLKNRPFPHTENPVVNKSMPSVGNESSVHTPENHVRMTQNKCISESALKQSFSVNGVAPWLLDPVGNISGIHLMPYNVVTHENLISAQQQYQEKMAEFGRLELEAKIIEGRMREIESKMMELDRPSERSGDGSHPKEIPEHWTLKLSYNDETSFASSRKNAFVYNYDNNNFTSAREKIRTNWTKRIHSSRRSSRIRHKTQPSFEFRDDTVDNQGFSETNHRYDRSRERSKEDGGIQRRAHCENYGSPKAKSDKVGSSAIKRLRISSKRKERRSEFYRDELSGKFSKPIHRSKTRSKTHEKPIESVSRVKNIQTATRSKQSSTVDDSVRCEFVRDSKKSLPVLRSEKIGDSFRDGQIGLVGDAKKSSTVSRLRKRAKIQSQSQLQICTKKNNDSVDSSMPRRNDSSKTQASSNSTRNHPLTRKNETQYTLADSCKVPDMVKACPTNQEKNFSVYSSGNEKCVESIVAGNSAVDTAVITKQATEGSYTEEQKEECLKEGHPNIDDKSQIANVRRDPLYWLAGSEHSSDDESWDFDGPMILPPPPL